MELSSVMIQNHQETERKLLILAAAVWLQLAFEDTLKPDYVDPEE